MLKVKLKIEEGEGEEIEWKILIVDLTYSFYHKTQKIGTYEFDMRQFLN